MRNDALFYTCSLIEYIGRDKKLRRDEVVDALGEDTVRRIYRYADVLHCEPIAKIADEFIRMAGIREGRYDNVAACKYLVPTYWDIGAVYSRLIEDVQGEDIITALMEVYHSRLSGYISDYNSAIYFQSRDYISLQYRQEMAGVDMFAG